MHKLSRSLLDFFVVIFFLNAKPFTDLFKQKRTIRLYGSF